MASTLPATRKSTPTCAGGDAANTSGYSVFHESAAAEKTATLNGVGKFIMALRGRTTVLLPSIA